MHLTNTSKAIRAGFFSLASSFLLAVIKVLAGIFGHSYALIADAIESLTDVFSTLLVIIGLKYAQKPPDENHPYGHGRIEPLVTFIIVAFLVFSATAIAFESIRQIQLPQRTPEPWTLIVLFLIIAWKELSFRFIMSKSRETGSTALRADAWHHRSDAITSILAFLGIAIAVLFGEDYAVADDWAALFASGFIFYNSYLIFRPALGEIMDEHLHDELVGDVRRIAVDVKGVMGTEKCYIRKAGMSYHIDLHALVDGRLTVIEGHDISHRLKDRLMSELDNITEVLIHIEPFQENYKRDDTARNDK